MLSMRTVVMTAMAVVGFGAGWLAKTSAQQKAPGAKLRQKTCREFYRGRPTFEADGALADPPRPTDDAGAAKGAC